jgi:hypothetical protein
MSKPKMTQARFGFLQSTVTRAMSQMNLLTMHNSMTLKLLATFPHGTHAYQGLDVGVHGPIKTYWGQERNKLEEETGDVVTKDNFIEVYSRAHLWAMTCVNIQSAF